MLWVLGAQQRGSLTHQMAMVITSTLFWLLFLISAPTVCTPANGSLVIRLSSLICVQHFSSWKSQAKAGPLCPVLCLQAHGLSSAGPMQLLQNLYTLALVAASGIS